MFSIIKRNLRYQTRDRVAFFLSFLSVIILIVIYKAFLGQFQIDAIKEATGANTVSQSGIDMVNFWLITGLTVVVSITSALSGFGVMVDDQENDKISDFRLSGIGSTKLMLAYSISSLIMSFVVTMISLLAGIAIFVGYSALGNFNINEWLRLGGIVFLSVLFSVMFTLPIVSFLKSRSGFSTVSTIIGTLVGFLSGVYIQVGNVSGFMAKVMLAFPMIHEGSLLKRILMRSNETDFFSGAPANIQESYNQTYGIKLLWGSHHITVNQSITFIVAWIILLLLINIIIALKSMRRQ